MSGVSGPSHCRVRCLTLETQCVSGVSGILEVSGLAGDREPRRIEIGEHTVSGVSGTRRGFGPAGDREPGRTEIGDSQCVRCVRYTPRFGNFFRSELQSVSGVSGIRPGFGRAGVGGYFRWMGLVSKQGYFSSSQPSHGFFKKGRYHSSFSGTVVWKRERWITITYDFFLCALGGRQSWHYALPVYSRLVCEKEQIRE